MGSEHQRGPLAEEKTAQESDGGLVEPQAAEVESARLLANEARPHLEPEGMSEEEIRQLADEFVARDRGDEVGGFVHWARERAHLHNAKPPPVGPSRPTS